MGLNYKNTTMEPGRVSKRQGVWGSMKPGRRKTARLPISGWNKQKKKSKTQQACLEMKLRANVLVWHVHKGLGSILSMETRNSGHL